MKKYFLIPSLFLLAIFCFSCGESDEEKQERKEKAKKNNPFNALVQLGKEMKNAGEKMEKAGDEQDAKQKERKLKGDTAAINYKELQKYLPESIDGYTKGKPSGSTMTMTGMSYSNAEVKFTNDNGGYVRVSILDYNAAYSLYSMATGMWLGGMSIENDQEKANSIKLEDGITGWETLKKDNKKASVVLGVGCRFLITVEANEQENTDIVKHVATSLKLEDLAKM